MSETETSRRNPSVFRFIRSIPLAVILIGYLAVTGVLATIVPQNLPAEGYYELYPKIVAVLITQTGFSSFFSSILFIIPAIIFFINLLLCTIDRFARQVKKREKKRFGPDIMHAGLLVLVVGAVLTFSSRQEGWVTLIPGESVELPDGTSLRLDDFEYLRYEDGRPEDWISSVSLIGEGGAVMRTQEIRVNHPLRINGLSIYQSSHSVVPAVVLSDSADEWFLFQGDSFSDQADSFTYTYMAPGGQEGEALLLKEHAGAQEVISVRTGTPVGSFIVKEITDIDATGLQAVKDPGYYPVIAAVILVVIGLFLTFYQKLGDMKE